jgi:hypothetical protein
MINREIIPKEYLREQYINKNRNIKDICIELNCSWGKVKKYLNKYGFKKDYHPNTKVLLNQKFGKLTVVEYIGVGTHKHNAVWKCLCECGNEHIVTGYVLNKGRTTSCGCVRTKYNLENKYLGGKYITGRQFGKYKINAKQRKLVFDITVEDVENQYEKQNKKCALSGVQIQFNDRCIGLNINNHSASIDRKDSNQGYTKENIQIVTKNINMSKMKKSDEEFIKMCCEVADYNRNK